MRRWRLPVSMFVALSFMLPLARTSAGAEKKATPDGQAIYKKQCNMCHYPDKADKKMGPGLKDLLKNQELPSSKKPATLEVVREQIEKGSRGMPAFAKKLSTEEMDSLMEYLKTL
jgi:mono/diheme cytochrome c family protein